MVRGNVIVGNVLLGIAAIIGAWIGGVEVDRLMTWRPVQATVIATDVQAVQGGSRSGVGYVPVVRYSYQVNGRQYESIGVTVIRLSSSWKWAESVRTRFAPGATVTAYINPSNPSAGFLVRWFSLLPLWFLLGGILLRGMFVWPRRPTRVRLVLNEDGTVTDNRQ